MKTDKIRDKLKECFVERFGDGKGGEKLFFSPSRINIIGEHIDYNGGKVLPCGLTIGTYGLAKKNSLNKIRLYSVNLDDYREIDLPLDETCRREDAWSDYACGVYLYLGKLGYEIGGMDIVVLGNIPNGAGLSSSASLELLFGIIANNFFCNDKAGKIDLVHAGVSAENDFLGLYTGIMDQYVIAFAKKGHALLLDTAKEDHVYVPFEIPGASLVVMNTGKRRELKDSKYNERRAECEKALEILRAESGKDEISDLCSLQSEDLDLLEKLDDPILVKRCKHVIKENDRVLKAVEALRKTDLITLGKLLRASQESLKNDYEVTGPNLDSICEAANDHPACYGARMTGAGFGGCAIALIKKDAIESFTEFVGKRYREETGFEAEFIISQVGDGAGFLS